MRSKRRKAPDPAGRSPGTSPDLFEDLAEILAGERSTYLLLGPKGAVLSVKWPEAFAFGESNVAGWIRMRPRRRAKALLDWIHRAAEYCRHPKIRQSWTDEEAA